MKKKLDITAKTIPTRTPGTDAANAESFDSSFTESSDTAVPIEPSSDDSSPDIPAEIYSASGPPKIPSMRSVRSLTFPKRIFSDGSIEFL